MAQENQPHRNQQSSQQNDSTPGKRDFGKQMETEKRDSSQSQVDSTRTSDRAGSQSQTGRDTDSLNK
jgi:hypothetical protein